MTTTSLHQNITRHASKMASAWAADVRVYDPKAATPITLDAKLQRLCGGHTPDYMTAHAFVFEGDPDYQTIITRYQICIDIIKAENKRRGHRRARFIAQLRAYEALQEWMSDMTAELPY